MNIDLSGKTALVTGGNTGIGRAISMALARAGADVALTYFAHPDDGEMTRLDIEGMGRKAVALKLDVTDSLQVKSTMAQAAESLGGHIDILVNNAGSMVKRISVSEMSDDHWFQVIDLNLSSAFFCCREVLPYMQSGWGRIINISSSAAHTGGGVGAVAYAAAKAGMLALTRGLAKELAPRGVTVNAVAPGLILGTYFHMNFSSPDVIKQQTAAIPLGRAGTADEVASVVAFYASNMSSFITGDCTEINGGAWFA